LQFSRCWATYQLFRKNGTTGQFLKLNIMTKEIAQKDWPAFCRMLSEKYADALVSIQLINGKQEQIAHSTRLGSLILDQQSDGCNNHLKFHLESSRYEI